MAQTWRWMQRAALATRIGGAVVDRVKHCRVLRICHGATTLAAPFFFVFQITGRLSSAATLTRAFLRGIPRGPQVGDGT
ncbi:hypothetical protein JWJ88_21610 (plasmid) [Paracoccus methylovorus]|uniref:Secreted protein n=1 Tax=Paracoccus methylovorus TaxID=2812658 RepID=A0ABX7JR47_9RHOB|nr:hypothetical protein [Paracoccus methylovorus]QRZ16139.1 hypothetical protein JWJ88_21610 [Paracoccus methylovorus]